MLGWLSREPARPARADGAAPARVSALGFFGAALLFGFVMAGRLNLSVAVLGPLLFTIGVGIASSLALTKADVNPMVIGSAGRLATASVRWRLARLWRGPRWHRPRPGYGRLRRADGCGGDWSRFALDRAAMGFGLAKTTD